MQFEKVLEGIQIALKDLGNFQVYVERETQDIQLPAFFITTPFSAMQKRIGDRYYKYHTVKILWLPDSKEAFPNMACTAMADMLCEALRYFKVGKYLLRGEGFEFYIREGQLSFQFQVGLNLLWDSGIHNPMQQLDNNTTHKTP